MTYNYLGLTNRIMKALNEVEVTQSEFSNADGFCAEAKDAINNAVRDVCIDQNFKWPFLYTEYTQVLTVPTVPNNIIKYSIASDAAVVDWTSFKVLNDSAISPVVKQYGYLQQIDYKQWLENNRYTDEDITDSTSFTKPRYVIRYPDNQWSVSLPPDQAYNITYDYYKYPATLVMYDDVPEIPETFEQVIIDAAMYYAYMFRDNVEQASMARKKYEDGLVRMRRSLIYKIEYIRAEQ